MKQAQEYLSNIEGLRRMIKQHEDYSQQMEEHNKAIEIVIEELTQLKLNNASQITKLL